MAFHESSNSNITSISESTERVLLVNAFIIAKYLMYCELRGDAVPHSRVYGIDSNCNLHGMPQSFLDNLPAELYTAIFSHIPAETLQQDVLALTRAIPRSSVPIYHLFEHIRLKEARQIIQLYRRLRNATDEKNWVKDFGVMTWTVDADVLVNLLGILPRISSLLLFVGPNFAPEHLEDIFHKPRQDLRFLSLRFRP